METEERWPIHRHAPDVEDLTPTREIFETGKAPAATDSYDAAVLRIT